MRVLTHRFRMPAGPEVGPVIRNLLTVACGAALAGAFLHTVIPAPDGATRHVVPLGACSAQYGDPGRTGVGFGPLASCEMTKDA